jgi:hypothetical protein
MRDVPTTVVFCSESIECFTGTKIMSGIISRKTLFGKHKPGFVDNNRTSFNELD